MGDAALRVDSHDTGGWRDAMLTLAGVGGRAGAPQGRGAGPGGALRLVHYRRSTSRALPGRGVRFRAPAVNGGVRSWKGRRIHFIGIGGAGMSGLALVADALGASVSGSDRAESPYLERLRSAGLQPVVGHDAAAVPKDSEVVVSTAIAEDNPELAVARRARANRPPPRAATGRDLAHEAGDRRGRTHGKTTTASMLAHALIEAGLDPSYLIGGELRSTGANAAWGEGEWAVIEADESDRSFFELAPEVAVITNVELDHHAKWRRRRELRLGSPASPPAVPESSGEVAHQAPALAAAGALTSASGRGRRRRRRARGARGAFEVADPGAQVPGAHNVLNALAAIAACREAGWARRGAPRAGNFNGAGRRFEPHGTTSSGARVFDDYAHHPTEVQPRSRRRAGTRRPAAVRLVPAAPVLAHEKSWPASSASRWRSPSRRGARHLPRPGGLRPSFPASAAGWLRPAPPTPPAGRPVYWPPGIEWRRRATRRAGGGRALTLGAGDVDSLARRLAAA